jgi:DNA-binding NarL/FixJ family response regulator
MTNSVGLIALFGTVLLGTTLTTLTTQTAGSRRRSRPPIDRAALGSAAPWETPAPHRLADGVQLCQEDLRLLALLAEGMPVSSVARRVAMSDRTIRRRIRAICEQLGVKATIQAIVWAARRGLV